jgi:hypothetical protein
MPTRNAGATNHDELPEKWRKHFPNSVEDAKTWEPACFRYALASRVLAVAKTRIEGMWCAYVDAVPGANHKNEMEDVLKHGSKLDEHFALELFPHFEGVPYAR